MFFYRSFSLLLSFRGDNDDSDAGHLLLVALLVIDSLAFRHVVHHWVDLLSQAHAARGCFDENTYKNSSKNNFRIVHSSDFFLKESYWNSLVRFQRDCPARFKGGQKWYQSIGLPLSYQRFALDSYFIQPPSWNSRKTIQRKIIQIY